MTTAGDRIREFCDKQGLTQAERDYLLGVVGEAVLAEREACARVAFGEEFAGDTPGCCRITASLIGAAIRDRKGD